MAVPRMGNPNHDIIFLRIYDLHVELSFLSGEGLLEHDLCPCSLLAYIHNLPILKNELLYKLSVEVESIEHRADHLCQSIDVLSGIIDILANNGHFCVLNIDPFCHFLHLELHILLKFHKNLLVLLPPPPHPLYTILQVCYILASFHIALYFSTDLLEFALQASLQFNCHLSLLDALIQSKLYEQGYLSLLLIDLHILHLLKPTIEKIDIAKNKSLVIIKCLVGESFGIKFGECFGVDFES